MEKYIDVETVKVIAHDYLCVQQEEDAFMSEIGEASTSDVAPARHGAWVDNVIVAPNVEEWGETERAIFAPDYKDGCKCNLCGAKTAEIQYPFCPYCGARMDGQAQ